MKLFLFCILAGIIVGVSGITNPIHENGHHWWATMEGTKATIVSASKTMLEKPTPGNIIAGYGNQMAWGVLLTILCLAAFKTDTVGWRQFWGLTGAPLGFSWFIFFRAFSSHDFTGMGFDLDATWVVLTLPWLIVLTAAVLFTRVLKFK